jgi:type I site-specific restriction-modification system R (restriction) subunit
MRREKRGASTYVFDPIRKAWFVLSPEEFVRQHLINYLCNIKQFPASLLSVEKQVVLNGQNKRYDVVVYRDLKPLLVIECKAPFIGLDEGVTEQALRYNLILKADYLMVSNGIQDKIYKGQTLLQDLPEYTNL